MWYSDDRNIIDGNLIFIPVYRKNICGNARKYKIIIWKAKIVSLLLYKIFPISNHSNRSLQFHSCSFNNLLYFLHFLIDLYCKEFHMISNYRSAVVYLSPFQRISKSHVGTWLSIKQFLPHRITTMYLRAWSS